MRLRLLTVTLAVGLIGAVSLASTATAEAATCPDYHACTWEGVYYQGPRQLYDNTWEGTWIHLGPSESAKNRLTNRKALLADGTNQKQLTFAGSNTQPNWSWK